MTQLALPLALPVDGNNDDFLVSTSNAQAARGIARWGAWPVMAALLVGPRKSGRTTLARLFARQSGGTFIDDAERHGEAALFHAWNNAQAERLPMLIIADAPPPVWSVRLPDLRSRLLASPVLTIDNPDEQLMAALLERDFARRGLDARPDLVQWLVSRLERTHITRMRAVDVLDQAVLETRKRLSIARARATLAAAGLLTEPILPDAQRSGATDI
ncbi:MAG: chromosomal replication initiator DnaA [Sphingomonas sp.]|jgi:chromosomal replication initiation ATPase DnaA